MEFLYLWFAVSRMPLANAKNCFVFDKHILNQIYSTWVELYARTANRSIYTPVNKTTRRRRERKNRVTFNSYGFKLSFRVVVGIIFRLLIDVSRKQLNSTLCRVSAEFECFSLACSAHGYNTLCTLCTMYI